MSRRLFLNRKGLKRETAAVVRLREAGAVFYPLFAKKDDDPNMQIVLLGEKTVFDQGTLSGLMVLEEMVQGLSDG